MTDPVPNATPRTLPEPDATGGPQGRPEPATGGPQGRPEPTTGGPQGRPESTPPSGGRPWPAPSPNSDWWRGRDAAAGRSGLLDGDTEQISTDQVLRRATPPGPAAPGPVTPAPVAPGAGASQPTAPGAVAPAAAAPEPARGRRRAPDPPVDEETGAPPAERPTRIGRHAARPGRPTVTFSQPAAKPADSPATPNTPAAAAQGGQTPPVRPGPVPPAGSVADDPAEPRTFEFTAPIRVTDDAPEPDTAKFVTPVTATHKAARATGPQQPPATGPKPPATGPKPPATGPQAAGKSPQPPATGPQPPVTGPQAAGTGPQAPAGRATAPGRPDEDDTRQIPIPVTAAKSIPAGATPGMPGPAGAAPVPPGPAAAAPVPPGPAAVTPARPESADNEDTRPIPVPAAKAPGRPAASTKSATAVTAPAGPERDAAPPADREDGFPLWPDGDGPTAPIPAKPRSQPAGAKAESGAGGDNAWQASEIRMMRGGRPPAQTSRAPQRPPKRATKKSRRPAVGLTALVLLALLAGFFGWVSADPFWLAVGHAERGTATVTKCLGSGLEARCVGTFTAATFSRDRVAVSALSEDEQRPGTTIPARMVSANGRVAYAGSVSSLHLWWIVGIALVLLCGLGIAWATGVGRLETRRARLVAFALSMGGPLLLVAGALAVTW